ncbi:WW domain-containing adapter protein with coiled-coil isoform X3 [Octopus sinensis]|uniref:WW domain-containing adapter protein with coiled-coil isoform X3 n=1 Tax=Octopus sinensis TaxID=2607531 RepID=A0A6P7SP93_9MOLL|nr:WW domain-containing adapter protein with coiled-coil isoform X3 [Octopus sinensis]
MVMHARKLPRLNDGYGDKKETHLYQGMQYPYTITSRCEKLRSSPDDDRTRDDSPRSRHSPRYQNKTTYIERTKEKLERGSTDSPTSDRRLNHYSYTSNNKNSSNHQNHDKNHKNDKDIKEQKEKDHKAEVQKSAVRVFGDWSEHISSSGKKYYYNCKTEVSQWEKPKEWHDMPNKGTDNKLQENKAPSKHNANLHSKSFPASDDRIKHSSVGEKFDKHHKVSLHQSSKSSDRSLSEKIKTGPPKDLQDVVAQRTSQWVQKGGQLQETSIKDNFRKDNTHVHNFDNTGVKRQRRDSEGSRSLGPSTPRKLEELNRETSITKVKALQTLQKLQEAISRQLSMSTQHTTVLSPKIVIPHADTSPQQSLKSPTLSTDSSHLPPVNVNPPPHEEESGKESPHSERSEKTDPTPSTSSSKELPVGPSALSAVSEKKDLSVELPPSLSNYCNDKLIGHVQGWQTEHAERQAKRYWEEGLTVGSLECSQVSVELKRARSLVRIAEIQSTLHEQRILFLAQQIKELENLKSQPPSYLSSD